MISNSEKLKINMYNLILIYFRKLSFYVDCVENCADILIFSPFCVCPQSLICAPDDSEEGKKYELFIIIIFVFN